MTPDDARTMYQNMISENGSAVSIRRYSGSGSLRTPVDVQTIGFVRTYSSKELIGSVAQGDQSVIVMADELTALLPIKRTDFVLLEDGSEYSIKNPMRRDVGGVLIAYELHTSG